MVKKEIHIDSYIAIKMINNDNKLHPDMEQYHDMKTEKCTLQATGYVIIPFMSLKKI